MNKLALIQKKLQRQTKVDAYNKSIAYRGIRYTPCSENPEDTHGSFVYRGHSYIK